jgi:hypothetical protein
MKKTIIYKLILLKFVFRIRIEQKCWIRIRSESIRIHNPALNPLPEVFTGEGGWIRSRVSSASGAATLPMSYFRKKKVGFVFHPYFYVQ